MALRIFNIKNNFLYVTNKFIINSFKQYGKIEDCGKLPNSPPPNLCATTKKKGIISHNSKVTRFKNGFRVATEDICKPITTIGLFIETGSRWETKSSNGIAHFHEHLILKGIPDMETKLNKISTQLSSYTTREVTGYYGTCLPQQVPQMIEIFADIVKYNKFDDAVINTERVESLNEMRDNDTNYKKVVFDFLYSTAFQGTPMGQSTFGTTKNVKNFNTHDISEYIQQNYKGSRMLLSGVGLICHDELCELTEEYFGKLENIKCYLEPCRFTGSEIRYRDDSIQSVYAIIALETCPMKDPDYFPLTVAAAIIGTYDQEPGSLYHPSHLIRASAESLMCNSFQSFHIDYSDTGLWGIYFNGDPLQAENMVYNIQKEWMKLCTMVTVNEVERGKCRLKTYLGRVLSGTEALCINMGKQLMYNNHCMEIPEMFCKIDDVTKSEVQNACMKYIYDQCPAVVVYGATENFPDYVRLRSGMYWLRF